MPVGPTVVTGILTGLKLVGSGIALAAGFAIAKRIEKRIDLFLWRRKHVTQGM